jgi:hypothetical protein
MRKALHENFHNTPFLAVPRNNGYKVIISRSKGAFTYLSKNVKLLSALAPRREGVQGNGGEHPLIISNLRI